MPRETWITREPLLDYIDTFTSEPVIYIQAPAGYGKTVTATLWIQRAKRRSAIIALDEYDNKLTDFCRRFCGALMQLDPGNDRLREYVQHPAFDSAPDNFTVYAMSMLSPGQAVVVLDDLHFIGNVHVLNLLPVLVRRMPAGMRLMILSRAAPPDSLSELAAKDAIAMISSDRLLFTSDEIALLFKEAGHPIAKKHADRLHAYTEGWPIGVNAVKLSGDTLLTRRIPPGHLGRYIKTQLWNKWSEPSRELMVKTAFIEELTPVLCEVLTGNADSGAVLDRLVAENAFITRDVDGVYRFHNLFRLFLMTQFEALDESVRREQYRRAAQWHYSRREYYRAIDYYELLQDEDGILRSMLGLSAEDYSGQFAIEDQLSIMRYPFMSKVMERHPFLLVTLAWGAFLEGRPAQTEQYMDLFYRSTPQIIKEYPQLGSHIYYLFCIDYRNPLTGMAGRMGKVPEASDIKAKAITITQYMPLLHRSTRDLSEIVPGDLAQNVEVVRGTIGVLFGDRQELVRLCALSGLRYERGELTEAHSLALSANALITPDCPPELRFCAMMLIAHIDRALYQNDRARLMADDIGRMIDETKAYYLNYNFDAYRCRCSLENGDMGAAEEWLRIYGADPFDHVTFFRLYGFITTARAHITLGAYDRAIVILKKVLELATAYRRPLDVIEAHILLAVAFWKKKRSHQHEGMKHLEQAIMLAEPYGYTQLFTNDGAELSNMLFRLQSRTGRRNYTGDLPGSFIKKLHLQSVHHAKHSKGMTGGRSAETRYTAQQRRVMKLLCEGCSYRQIADILGIKFSTVRSHIELIYKKLDVANQADAVARITELGVLGDIESGTVI